MPRFLRLALIALARDFRAGELRLIAAAITIAVASLASAGFFTDRVQRAIENQATELLAADLVLSSGDPIEDALMQRAGEAGLRHTRTVTFRSVVLAGERMQLSEVKAVEAGYPIRGELRTSTALFGEEETASSVPAPGSVWVDGRLLQELGLSVGDSVSLGTGTFTIERVITYEPDRGGDLFSIAPRLLMNLADLEGTGLLGPGSRVRYRLLLGGAPDDIAAFRNSVAGTEGLSVQGIRDERPELKRSLERAEQFLGLSVLVSVALCGLAIAMSARRYAARHFDVCAVMRCLGAGQSFITRLYVTQLVLLAVAFGLLGSLAGFLGQEVLAQALQGLTGRELPSPSLLPAAAGLAAGLAATMGFALPQIWRLRNVPPLRVFRRELAPVRTSALIVYGAAVATLGVLTPWQAGQPRLTAFVLAGLAGTALALAAGGLLLVRLSSRLRSRVGVSWRYGFANLSRRSGGSVAQVMAIGLGVTVLLLITFIRTDLLDAWRDRLPPGTPNYFLINIQPDEVDDVQAYLGERLGVKRDLFPMVRARLTRINDQRVVPGRYEDDRARRLAAREFNLSWTGDLQADNRLVEGDWWEPEEAGTFFSVEEGIARSLGIRNGDTLTYSVAGQEITGTVRNIRAVDWDSFNVNFFVTLNPGALEGFPATFITSFYTPPGERGLLVDLVRRFPSVTVIDVAALLSQVRTIMDQVSRTVEFVFAFTLLAGIIVLFAALQTTHDERRRESAVLRALGADRRCVLASLAAEFLALGCIAGILAATAAALIEQVLARFVFELEVMPNPMLWVAGIAACVLVVAGGGLLGTRRIASVPPAVALRGA